MSTFASGDRVRVRAASTPGHVRTPYYVRGKTGIVSAVVGSFENPEELAYGRRGRNAILYNVQFAQGDVFGDAPSPSDTIAVEIFEHWLERA